MHITWCAEITSSEMFLQALTLKLEQLAFLTRVTLDNETNSKLAFTYFLRERKIAL